MAQISIKNLKKIFKYTTTKNLLDILLQEEVFIDSPCNGMGTCGKCKVRILEGNVAAPTEAEARMLKQDELLAGIRLACFIEVKDDIVIETLQKEGSHKILTKGYMPNFDFNPPIRKEVYNIEKPSLEDQTPLEETLCKTLKVNEIDWRLLQEEIPYGIVTAVYHGEKLMGLEVGNTKEEVYGVAIDIGTTTVVASLIDLNTGNELAVASMINPQKKFGLDVLTRITFQVEHPDDGKNQLQQAIVTGINQLLEDLCKETQIQLKSIYEISVAANCTMMHFLLGIDASSIGRAPYAPVFIKAKNISAQGIGLKAAPFARLYCLPSVSSYIGADIVAGAYVCQLNKTEKNLLFIDIGTNGEIVLSNKGNLLSCSCAAGPALEGMNISAGMRAAEGAIEDVRISDGEVKVKVIGETEAIGICGSGILAAIKELVAVGLIKKDGAFIKKNQLEETDFLYPMIQLDGLKREFILTNKPHKLLITQGDVRQVQLAKGAILSGFYALLKETSIDMEELDQILIAGQFGAHLPADSLVGTGILPQKVKDKVVYVGNTSKTGAYMALMSMEVRGEIEALAHGMKYMELGATEGYERLFAQCLRFDI